MSSLLNRILDLERGDRYSSAVRLVPKPPSERGTIKILFRETVRLIRKTPATRLLSLLAAVFCCASAAQNRAPADSTAAFFERLGPFGGEVRSLLISPVNSHLVYLGTSDGQLYKSVDGGMTWANPHPGLGRRQFVVDTLVHHPTESGHLFAAGWDLRSDGGDLLETRDGGETWSTVQLPEKSPAVRDLAICASRPSRMIAGTLTGAYVTDDGGLSWRRVGQSNGGIKMVESVAIDPKDPDRIYAGTWRLSYRSSDFGKTWVCAETGMLLDSDVFSIEIDPRNPEIIFASACSGVYRSANRAGTWSRLKLLANRAAIRAQLVYIDPTDSRRIYAGTTEGLFVTESDGQEWQRITAADLTINAIQVDPADRARILIGTGNRGVLRSENGGRSWGEANTGFTNRHVSRILPAPGAGGSFFAGVVSEGNQGGFYLFDGGIPHWRRLTVGLENGTDILAYLAMPGAGFALAGTGRGAYIKRGSAEAWMRLEGVLGSLVVNDLRYDPEKSWIFAATNHGVYRARPDRLVFLQAAKSAAHERAWSISVSPLRPGTIFASSVSGVLRSRDEGATWDVFSAGLPPKMRIQCLAVSPSDPEHLFCGTAAGLFESRDEGVSWRRVGDSRLGIDVPSIAFLDRSGQMVVAADGTFGGVFLSNDGGTAWSRIESPGFSSPLRALAVDSSCQSCIYLGTRSDGVYRLLLPEAGRIPTGH